MTDYEIIYKYSRLHRAELLAEFEKAIKEKDVSRRDAIRQAIILRMGKRDKDGFENSTGYSSYGGTSKELHPMEAVILEKQKAKIKKDPIILADGLNLFAYGIFGRDPGILQGPLDLFADQYIGSVNRALAMFSKLSGKSKDDLKELLACPIPNGPMGLVLANAGWTLIGKLPCPKKKKSTERISQMKDLPSPQQPKSKGKKSTSGSSLF